MVPLARFVFQACSFIRLRSRLGSARAMARCLAEAATCPQEREGGRRVGGQPLGHLSVFGINDLRAVFDQSIANAFRILLARDEIWIQRFTDGGRDDIAEIVSDR